jgi:hypothetical protein
MHSHAGVSGGESRISFDQTWYLLNTLLPAFGLHAPHARIIQFLPHRFYTPGRPDHYIVGTPKRIGNDPEPVRGFVDQFFLGALLSNQKPPIIEAGLEAMSAVAEAFPQGLLLTNLPGDVDYRFYVLAPLRTKTGQFLFTQEAPVARYLTRIAPGEPLTSQSTFNMQVLAIIAGSVHYLGASAAQPGSLSSLPSRGLQATLHEATSLLQANYPTHFSASHHADLQQLVASLQDIVQVPDFFSRFNGLPRAWVHNNLLWRHVFQCSERFTLTLKGLMTTTWAPRIFDLTHVLCAGGDGVHPSDRLRDELTFRALLRSYVASSRTALTIDEADLLGEVVFTQLVTHAVGWYRMGALDEFVQSTQWATLILQQKRIINAAAKELRM